MYGCTNNGTYGPSYIVAHQQTIADDNGDLIGLSALGTWRQTFRRAAFLNRWAAKPAGKKEDFVCLFVWNKSFIFISS